MLLFGGLAEKLCFAEVTSLEDIVVEWPPDVPKGSDPQLREGIAEAMRMSLGI